MSSEAAYLVEKSSEEDTVGSILTILRKTFGPSVPPPLRVFITTWGKDELSLGSFSYVPIGSSPQVRDTLAQPGHGNVFFAGEATHNHPCRLGAAFLSGVREAARIRQRYGSE
jgi:monoamine oxidase